MYINSKRNYFLHHIIIVIEKQLSNIKIRAESSYAIKNVL